MSKRAHCIELHSECVRLRDRWCIICGRPGSEVHHVIFRSEGCWQIQFDTDYGVYLCSFCHQEAPYAPHIDKEAFEEKFINFIEDEGRRQKIIETLSKATPVSNSAPYDEIAGHLSLELKDRKETYELNYDCCPREIWK